MKNALLQSAMAFYHEDGFVPAWKQAVKFSGKNGHIATMLDIVDARIATGIDQHPWNTYYTVNSAEYFGYGADGRRKLIVAHGVGPMSTLEGIQKAYSFQYKDKTRKNKGGRISQDEFLKLEAGEYGEVYNADEMGPLKDGDGKFGMVAVVDFDNFVDYYEYPFIGYLTLNEARREPLMRARLGPRYREYLEHHTRMATAIHAKEHGKAIPDPYIVEIGAASNCTYTADGFANHPRTYPWLDKGDGAVAHLLSTGRLSNVYHERERRVPHSIANNIGCHEWFNGVRLVAVREGGAITDIHPGVGSVRCLILKNWDRLLKKIPGEPPFPGTFYVLMEHDGVMFTQYQKKGAGLDTTAPEFHVTSAKPIGEPTKFVTEVLGYHGFFKYDIREVETMKPTDTNAYMVVGEPEIIWDDGNPTRQHVDVQFYRVEVDTSQRLVRDEELRNDFDTLMKLLADEEQAA